MDDFTTLAYLLSYPGMIATVILMTQVTKSMLDSFFENKFNRHIRTEIVVYSWALFFCIIAMLYLGSFEGFMQILETIVVWLINSAIVWLAAMKTFEKATKT